MKAFQAYSNGLSEIILGKAIKQINLPRDEDSHYDQGLRSRHAEPRRPVASYRESRPDRVHEPVWP